MTIAPVAFRTLELHRRSQPASAPAREPEDQVELKDAPPLALRAMLGSSWEATRSLAGRLVFGPVCHGIGVVLKLVGYKPKPYVLPLPKDALGELPESRLQRPFLLVHGWHHRKELFESLTNKLTHDGANGGRVGYVRSGRLYEDAECTRPLAHPGPDLRVFVSMFETYRDAPDVAALQLKQNLDTIRALTGQSKVDVAAHSMGGLATRRLVDTCPEHGIGKFMMVGTPNGGVSMASMSEAALDAEDRGWDVRWVLDLKDCQPADRGALEWLKPDSPERRAMNERWPQQQASLEATMHVGADDKITLGNRYLPVWGDKLIPASSLELDGLEVRHVHRKGLYSVHGNLLWHPDTYTTMRSYFGWQ